MSDDKLRGLERIWQESGSNEDQRNYFREKVRQGEAYETAILDLGGFRGDVPTRYLVLNNNASNIGHTINLKNLITNPRSTNAYTTKIIFAEDKLHILQRIDSNSNELRSINEDGNVERRLLPSHVNSIINYKGTLAFVEELALNRFRIVNENITVPEEGNYLGIPFHYTDEKIYLAQENRPTRIQILNQSKNELGSISILHLLFIENQKGHFYLDMNNDQRELFGNWFVSLDPKQMHKVSEKDKFPFLHSLVPETSRTYNRMWYVENEEDLMTSYNSEGNTLALEVRRSYIENLVKNYKNPSLTLLPPFDFFEEREVPPWGDITNFNLE